MAVQVNTVELIKDRLDIADALSIYAGADLSRISLKREKVSIKCPFHHDKSPSMTVYLKDNRFRCWVGCNGGKHGDVIDVVRLGHNLSMADAIKQLRNDLKIESGKTDQETTTRIIEKRRALAKIKIDRDTLDWTLDTLQWLHREISKQSKSIKTECDLEEWAPLIYVHAEIEYNLDCLLGLEDLWEWEKADIVEWTKALMEGVRRHVGVGRNGK